MVNHLIAPHGGELIDLIVEEERKGILKDLALHINSITLSERQLCDLELLMNGGFSPLRGFMSQPDYESVVDRMRLQDGTLLGLALPSGQPVDCRAEPLRKVGGLPGMSESRWEADVPARRLRYDVHVVSGPESVLEASARRTERLLWRRRLEVVPTRRGFAAVATERALLLAGVDTKNRTESLLVALDAETGRQLYSVSLKGRTIPERGLAMVPNGKWVLLWADYGVTAIDPVAGRAVWRVQ